MKCILFIIFLLFTNFGFSQFISEDDLNIKKKEGNPNLKNVHLVDSVIVNENISKPYLSGIKFYNSLGKDDIQYLFSKKGDTVEIIKTLYPNKLLEIVIYKNREQIDDTLFLYYNNRSQLKLELWKSGEDKVVDSTKFYYDDQNRIEYKLDYYNKSNFIEKSPGISINNHKTYNSRDSLTYNYNKKDLLVNIKMYDINNDLFSEYSIEYEQKDKPKRIIRHTDDYNLKLTYETIIEYEYYDNNYLKSQKVTNYLNNEFRSNVIWYYSKLGFIEKGQTKDINGKIIFERKATLQDNSR